VQSLVIVACIVKI